MAPVTAGLAAIFSSVLCRWTVNEAETDSQ